MGMMRLSAHSLERTTEMTVDRAVMMFAGIVILVSLGLGLSLSPYWFLLTAFVGLNLMQASVTGFCPAAVILKKLGVKPGVAFE
jgi:hypothetical protein